MSGLSKCTICRHSLAPAINADLLQGRSVRAVAMAYTDTKGSALSKSTVQRHKVVCMAGDFAMAAEAARLDLEKSGADKARAVALTTNEQTRRILNGVEMADIITQVVVDLKTLRDRAMGTDGELREDVSIKDTVSILDKLLKASDSYSKLSAEFREREKMREDQIRRDWVKMKMYMLNRLDPYPDAKEGFLNDISVLGSSVFN